MEEVEDVQRKLGEVVVSSGSESLRWFVDNCMSPLLSSFLPSSSPPFLSLTILPNAHNPH